MFRKLLLNVCLAGFLLAPLGLFAGCVTHERDVYVEHSHPYWHDHVIVEHHDWHHDRW